MSTGNDLRATHVERPPNLLGGLDNLGSTLGNTRVRQIVRSASDAYRSDGCAASDDDRRRDAANPLLVLFKIERKAAFSDLANRLDELTQTRNRTLGSAERWVEQRRPVGLWKLRDERLTQRRCLHREP